jgi:hypothetical protein
MRPISEAALVGADPGQPRLVTAANASGTTHPPVPEPQKLPAGDTHQGPPLLEAPTNTKSLVVGDSSDPDPIFPSSSMPTPVPTGFALPPAARASETPSPQVGKEVVESDTIPSSISEPPQLPMEDLPDEAGVNVQPKARRKAVSTAVQDDNNEPVPGPSRTTARPQSKQDDSGMVMQISPPDGVDKQTSVTVPSKRMSPEEFTDEEADFSRWENSLPEDCKEYAWWKWRKSRKQQKSRAAII